MRRRRSLPARALGVDAEPYRGRLVESRGPRVGIVGHGLDRHRVRDSLMARRNSMPVDRPSEYGRPGTETWQRASNHDTYRRGFIAGVVVSGSACGMLMLVGFFSLGGAERLAQRLTPAAEEASAEAGRPDPWAHVASELEAEQEGRAQPTAPPARDDGRAKTAIEQRGRDLDAIANEDYGGRDYGFDELVKTHRHNRKVLQTGGKFINALVGKGGQADEGDGSE